MRILPPAAILFLLTPTLAAHADSIFNFESTPQYTASPFAVTNNGITASFSTSYPGSATVCATNGFFQTISGNALTEEFCSLSLIRPINVAFSQNLSSLSFNFATPGDYAPFYASFYEDGVLVGTDVFSDAIPPGYLVAEGVANITGTFNSVSLALGGPPSSGSTSPFVIDNLDAVASPVPEPSSLVLLATGLLGMANRVRRRFVS